MRGIFHNINIDAVFNRSFLYTGKDKGINYLHTTAMIGESTIDSEGFKGGTRGAPIMPRDAVSRTANVERTARH